MTGEEGDVSGNSLMTSLDPWTESPPLTATTPVNNGFEDKKRDKKASVISYFTGIYHKSISGSDFTNSIIYCIATHPSRKRRKSSKCSVLLFGSGGDQCCCLQEIG